MQISCHSALDATHVSRAALAWLVFVVAFWILGPYSNYAPPGAIDPWIPTGYFLNFEDLVSRHGFRYYVSRIPFILTGVSFYKIFTPHVANFVLHSLYLWLACFGLYSAAAGPFGKSAAIIATVAFAFSTYTASSMAWDYPNGAAIAFVLLGVWLALAPPAAMSDWVRWVAVGFLWAVAGTDNLLAALVVLPCCLMVLYLADFSLAESARRTCLILIGVGLMLVTFGILSKWLFGTFFFLQAQIDLVSYVTSRPDYLSNMWGRGNDWIPTDFRGAALLGICITAVAALVTARRTRRHDFKAASAVIGLFFLTLCVFGFVEFVLQGVVLRVTYTSVYLVAPAYLALAAALSLITQDWPPRATRVAVAISAIVVIAIPFSATLILPWATRFPWSVWLLQVAPAVIILFALFLPAGIARRSVSVLGGLALVALPALATTADVRLHWIFRRNEPTFAAALKVSDILRSGVAKGRTVRFWFDTDEPHSSKFLAIGSLYLGEWQGLRGFPSWTDLEVRNNLPENTILVHLTSKADKLDAREYQMKARGIMFGPRRSIPIIVPGGTEFILILQDIHGYGAATR
jgi:hypothetical protein